MGKKSKGKSNETKRPSQVDWIDWNSDSADGIFLQTLIESQAVNGMSAAEIRKAYKKNFMKYKPNNFAANVRRLRDIWSLDPKNPNCVSENEPVARRTKYSDEEDEDDDDDYTFDDEEDISVTCDSMNRMRLRGDAFSAASPKQKSRVQDRTVIMYPKHVVPWWVMSRWTDNNLFKRITIEISPLSIPILHGIYWISQCGNYLQGRYKLSKAWCDVDLRNSEFFPLKNGQTQYSCTHPRTIAQKEVTRELMGTKYESDWHDVFIMPIMLPFKCERQFTDREDRKGFCHRYASPNTYVSVLELIADNGGKTGGVAEMQVPADVQRASNPAFVPDGLKHFSPSVAGDASVVSIDPFTGKTRRVVKNTKIRKGVPSFIEMQSVYEEITVGEDDDVEMDSKPPANLFPSNPNRHEEMQNMQNLPSYFPHAQQSPREYAAMTQSSAIQSPTSGMNPREVMNPAPVMYTAPAAMVPGTFLMQSATQPQLYSSLIQPQDTVAMQHQAAIKHFSKPPPSESLPVMPPSSQYPAAMYNSVAMPPPSPRASVMPPPSTEAAVMPPHSPRAAMPAPSPIRKGAMTPPSITPKIPSPLKEVQNAPAAAAANLNPPLRENKEDLVKKRKGHLDALSAAVALRGRIPSDQSRQQEPSVSSDASYNTMATNKLTKAGRPKRNVKTPHDLDSNKK